MNRDIATLREVISKLTQMLAGQGLKVTQQGSSAFVQADANGKPIRVNIPFVPDNADPKLVLAIQGFIDHEVAHILFTDWNVVNEAARMGKAVDSLQNIVEDTFIERAIGKKLPGTTYNLGRLHEFFVDEITTPALAKVAGDPMKEFSILLVPVCRAWAGQPQFQKYLSDNKLWDHPAVKEFVSKVDPKTIARFAHLANSRDCLDVALELHKAMTSSAPGDGTGEGKECQAKGKGPSKGKPSGESGDKAESTSEKSEKTDKIEGKPKKADKADKSEEEFEDKSEPENNAGDEGEPSEDEGDESDEDDGEDNGEFDDSADKNDDGEQSADEGEGNEDAGETGSLGSEGERPEDGEFINRSPKGSDEVFDPSKVDFDQARFDGKIAEHISDEAGRAIKDADYSIFSKDYDVMERYEVGRSYSDSQLTTMENETRHMVGVMQKDIERMMAAQNRVMRVPGYRSGRLHSSALHKLVTGDERVFQRKFDAPAKNTVVGLLIDNSGSMMGSKMETAMKVGFSLSQTLERVGIPHEVLGFTTGRGTSDYSHSVIQNEQNRLGVRFSRTEPLYMPIYKDFGERLTSGVKQRFADAAANQYFLSQNIDGESVEIAVQRLMKRPEKRKVLLVLSDGNPACCGPRPRDLYSHLHKVIADATKAKIEMVGIGIQSDAVKTFYPRNFVIHKLEQLPATVMGELKRILTAA